MDFPRLREPLLSIILAGLCFILAWRGERLPDWLRLFLAFMGCVFSAAALVTGLDFLTYRVSERIRGLSAARYYGPNMFAASLRGLTMSQTDMVMRQMGLGVVGIPGDGGPAWMVRCSTMDVPLGFVADFFEWSKQTAPYLWPVRDGAQVGGGDGWTNGVQYATELTNSIIAMGYASRASGRYAAVLTEPIETVAGRYGVEV